MPRLHQGRPPATRRHAAAVTGGRARQLLTVGLLLAALGCVAGCNRSGAADGRAAEPAASLPARATSPAQAAASTMPQSAHPATASASAEQARRQPALRLLTYNVLATPVYAELRTEAVLRILRDSQADVIALQEVAGWFVSTLVSQPWVKEHYRFSEHNGEPFAPGGQFILSRQPIAQLRVAQLSGRQRRTVLVADIMLEGGSRLTVATSHLESFLPDGPTRARQLKDIFTMLESAEHAVLMGDLNFGDNEQPETGQLDARYADVWSKLRPGQAGYTWNNEANPLAGIGAFAGEPSRRLDRILLRSAHLQPVDVAIIGNQAAGERRLTPQARAQIEMPERAGETPGEPMIAVFPSDHYGLLTTLKWH